MFSGILEACRRRDQGHARESLIISIACHHLPREWRLARGISEISLKSLEYAFRHSRDRAMARSSILELDSRTWAWYTGERADERIRLFPSLPSLAGKSCRGSGICMVLSFLFDDGYATCLPRCSHFILWICDAVALRYLRGRPLIFAAILNMLAHAEPILEEMHGGSFVRREYGEYRRCDSTC